MNNEEDSVIFCSKCGSEMKKTSRYCMKCGNLNYDHPLNESMRSYIDNSGVSINEVLSLTKTNVEPQSYKACFIVNLILSCLFPITIVILSGVLKLEIELSLIFALFIMSGIMFLYSYSIQCIFIKGNEPWWSFFIPFYGVYVYFDVAFGNGWLFLLQLLPGVGTILMLISFYMLGKKFSKSALLTLFFPYIMIPVIAFDKNSNLALINSNRENSIDKKGRTKSEVVYKRNRIMITIIILVIILIFVFLFWRYIKNFILFFIDILKEGLEYFK